MHKLKGSELQFYSCSIQKALQKALYIWICGFVLPHVRLLLIEFKNFVVAKETRKRSGTQFLRIDKLVKTKQN